MLTCGNKSLIDKGGFSSVATPRHFKNLIRLLFLYQDYNFSYQVFFLLRFMDGKTSDEDLKCKFKERFSIELTDNDFTRLIHTLRKHRLVVKKNNNYLLSKLSYLFQVQLFRKCSSLFKKAKINDAMFNGVLYGARPKDLKRELRLCFNSVNKKKLCRILGKINTLKGVIVPHSNIELSGSCAAWAYKAIEIMGLPDLVILLVPNHALPLESSPFSVCAKPLRSPLGVVKTDRYFINRLARECKFDIFQEEFVHIYEHAIGIQLPFLQFIYNSAHKHLLIVPVVCHLPYFRKHDKHLERPVHQFLNSLRNCIIRSRKRILVIASGDLHHQERWRASADFHKKNQKIIQLMSKADKRLFYKYALKSKDTHACCKDPFLAFLELLEPKQGLLLDYSWPSKRNALEKIKRKKQYHSLQIGFASMVF